MKRNPLFILYLAIFINSLGFGIIFPLLPFYAKSFQASEITIGLLASSYAISQFFFSPLWGRLSDRFGRKPIIALSLLGLAISFVSFGLAKNLIFLFVSRIFQGIFSAAAMPTAQAYVADASKKDERTKFMGRLGAATALGFILGPAFGGLLSHNGFPLPFFTAAIISFLSFLFVLFWLPEVISKKEESFVAKEGIFNFGQIWQAPLEVIGRKIFQIFLRRNNKIKENNIALDNKTINKKGGKLLTGQGLKSRLLPYFIMAGLWSYGLSNNQVAIPLLAMEKISLSSTSIGWLFTLMAVTSVLIQGFFLGRISQRIAELKIVRTGLLIMALGLFFMAFSNSFVFLVITMMILAIGSAFTRPTLNSLISKLTPESQGVSLGTTASFEAMGRILGPLTGGLLFQHFQGFGPLWTSAFLIFIFLFLYQKIPLKNKN